MSYLATRQAVADATVCGELRRACRGHTDTLAGDGLADQWLRGQSPVGERPKIGNSEQRNDNGADEAHEP